MDACTELQPQIISSDIHVDSPLYGICKERVAHEPSPECKSKKELLCHQQVNFKQIVTLCPTSTPVNGHDNDFTYSHTPHTSPPPLTPITTTLSRSEDADVHPQATLDDSTTSFFASSTPTYIPCLHSKIIIKVDPTKYCCNDANQPVGLQSSDQSIVVDSAETIESSPRELMSPVKLPLHTTYSQNCTQSISPKSISKPPFLKRTHAETENDFKSTLIPSPKKVRTTPGTVSPHMGNVLRQSKASRPFMPPKFKRSNSILDSATSGQNSPHTPPAKSEPKSSLDNTLLSAKVNSHIRHTVAVSKQFKSPFRSPLSSLSTITNKSASSPNIRALEKKIVMLKRATKIVTEKEDDKLKGLIQKWKLAGREVAWELWSIVKDRGPENAMMWGDKEDRFDSNWSWPTKRNWGCDERRDGGTDEENLGDPSISSQFEAEMWNTINIKTTIKRQEAGDDMSSPHTLGTMLRSYGITDDILGWNNDEEDFKPLASD